jgi:hypothetical protein
MGVHARALAGFEPMAEDSNPLHEGVKLSWAFCLLGRPQLEFAQDYYTNGGNSPSQTNPWWHTLSKNWSMSSQLMLENVT